MDDLARLKKKQKRSWSSFIMMDIFTLLLTILCFLVAEVDARAVIPIVFLTAAALAGYVDYRIVSLKIEMLERQHS
ncbi:MAG: hypothetical protein GXY33_20030 [Phycisphaerae bacterium]|nr:hypothetical protein [Phycisphaerae bacterium]